MSEERARITAAALLALAALAIGLLGGRATKHTPTDRAVGGVSFAGGIPVGVARTPAGALAAADNYVAIASQTVEQAPTVFAQLVVAAYAPSVRALTLAQAAAIRAADPADMRNYASGGRAVAVIGARRLDSYNPARATVTTWLGGFVWGPRVTPRQSWNLVATTLAWQGGRWVVLSSDPTPAPAPVPSVVFTDGRNNQAAAFDQGLAGMTAPFYAAPAG
jgi:hypothetical protein